MKSIAVGLDGSESSWKAFREALRQAQYQGAELHVVSIQESVHPSFNPSEILEEVETARDRLEKLQEEAVRKARDAAVEVETSILIGRPAHAMVDFIRKTGIELLIVGDTGHSSIWGTLLGNTADKIVRYAPCSVLIVR